MLEETAALLDALSGRDVRTQAACGKTVGTRLAGRPHAGGPPADDVRAALLAITRGTPLPKPTDHKGARDTDMFEVDLSRAVVRSIVAAVDDAVGRGLRTPRSTKIGGFATAWRELGDWQGEHG